MSEREIIDNLLEEPTEVLPYDLDSEKALLTLCIKNKDTLNVILKSTISSKDFYDRRNQIVFEAVSDLYLNSMTIDPYTVNDYLKRKGLLEKVGGYSFVPTLVDSYAVASNVEEYIKIIASKSKLRLFIMTLDELSKKGKGGQGDVNDLIDIGIEKLSAMREAEEGIGFEALASIIKRNIHEITQIKSGKYTGKIVKTGFSYLDHLLGGLRPGTLNIIAARPGMGKTSFVINIATNVAQFYNVPVDIFSLEMSKAEVANRIISGRTTTSSKKLQNANISEAELFEVAKACQDISQYPIYIDDNSSVNPITMLSSCKSLKAEGKLGLVIVDYLQLMSMPGNRGSNYSRNNEITDISRSLKILAKELDVPVIALSQLARGAEKRDDHTPMLSDLRDSGAIEQDADSVIFIDRDDYYDKDKRSNPIQDAKIHIAKNRHGEPGIVKLKWCGARTLFYEEDKNADPSEQAQVSPYARTTTPGGAAADYKFDDNGVEKTPDAPAAPDAGGPAPEGYEPAGEAAPYAPVDSYEEPEPENTDDGFDDFGDGGFASEMPDGWGEE
ncbi:MAG: replicative DNA helicase [Clostridia bacterium]|nr:replicative DNA helicase [Clostridia bacterium]